MSLTRSAPSLSRLSLVPLKQTKHIRLSSSRPCIPTRSTLPNIPKRPNLHTQQLHAPIKGTSSSIWRVVIPALATQAGLFLSSPGIHLEALVPSENSSVKEARPIPLLKTELVQEIQRPSFLRRLKQYLEDMLEDYVVHPVLTIWRFGVLMVIFMPLILTVPAVFIGERKADKDNERSGTLWW
ncbi:hypothetical protein BGZ74_008471 [Mortierella antarctica]|nr:hypothetical protein BGZ74_008471 [Mortierella antarctica]